MSASERSGAVTAAAVVAIGGSVLVLLGAGFGSLGVFMNPQVQQASALQLRYAGFVGIFLIAATGIWGMASGIGLLTYRNWARISTLVWSGLTVVFGGLTLLFAVAIKFPVPPDAPPEVANVIRVGLLFFYGTPVLIAIWWLILFTRNHIAALFVPPLASSQPLDASGFPATARLRCPLPIVVISWFFMVSPVLGLGFLFLQKPMMLLLGRTIHGPAAVLFFVLSGAVGFAAGFGVLKLKPWGFWLMMALQLFALLNGTVSLLSPNYAQTMREMLAASRFAPTSQAPWPMQNSRLFAALVLVLWAVVPVILLTYRSHFTTPAPSERRS